MSTLAEKRHMGRVAQLPCVVCGAMPVEVHHVLEGRNGVRSSDYLTIPVCPDCHRGTKNGIHGERRMWTVRKISEMEALALTIGALYGGAR